MEYEAILFDNDGVLLERTSSDRSVFEAAIRDAFNEHGVTAPDPEHVADLVYGVTVSRLTTICETYGLETDSFWLSRDRACSQVQRDAIAAGEKGLYPDVNALNELERPTGVVSTNQHPTLTFAYDRLDTPSFDVVQGRPMTVESLRRKKPNPYYLEKTLHDIGTEAALYVGDSEHDVIAARNAGIDAAFLRRDHNDDVSLSVTPDHELASLYGLSAILE
ncbi:HAD family hydrolase [Natrinema ejinorense]|uniref:Hydrolase n=1 Tax=Natrinema ejinorense TaxID=373386 RepID=A0A2A5QWT2_9EURY|nr:HAD-IA family hydrolase [Natrinema ejinorense]PCR91290.1 hydrolase [Natrinema ejinorense]